MLWGQVVVPKKSTQRKSNFFFAKGEKAQVTRTGTARKRGVRGDQGGGVTWSEKGVNHTEPNSGQRGREKECPSQLLGKEGVH